MKSLLVPEDIIMSVKDANNQSFVDFTAISNEKVFLCHRNVAYMVKTMFIAHKKNGGSLKISNFENYIPKLMVKWSVKENLDSFEGWNNNHWVLTLDYINQRFIKDNDQSFHTFGGDVNVFKTIAPVCSMDDDSNLQCQHKKYDQMTAEDYQNLDVYGPVESWTQNNRVKRYKNKIPFWQQTMNIRHYERSNEGFRSKNKNRASLEVPIRGYNMSKILETTGREKNLEWTRM
jgi:hypothetical protein